MLRKRCSEKRSKGLFSFVIITAILFLLMEGFFYIEKKLRPALLTVAEMKAGWEATDAINSAVLDKVAGGIDYRDLIHVEQDDQGKIVMARLNSGEINRVMAETYAAVKDALSTMQRESIEIPLGEVLDSYILATYGPSIPVRLIPAGKVNTELIDCFENAGINQTRHKIYLKIYAEVQILIPFTATPTIVETTVPITDTIYLGPVPDTVINLVYPRQAFP